MAQSANTAFLPSNYPDRAPASGIMNPDAEWTLTGSLTLNRFIPFFKIPGGKRIEGIMWDFPILDSNGSPLVQFQIGIPGTPALFVAATTPGAAASKGNALATTGINYQTLPGETIVGVTISTAAATTNPSPLTPLYLRLSYKDA